MAPPAEFGKWEKHCKSEKRLMNKRMNLVSSRETSQRHVASSVWTNVLATLSSSGYPASGHAQVGRLVWIGMDVRVYVGFATGFFFLGGTNYKGSSQYFGYRHKQSSYGGTSGSVIRWPGQSV